MASPAVVRPARAKAEAILQQAAEAIEPPVARAIRSAQTFFREHPGERITVVELAGLAKTAADTARTVLEGFLEQGAIRCDRGRGPRPDKFWFESPDDDPDPDLHQFKTNAGMSTGPPKPK